MEENTAMDTNLMNSQQISLSAGAWNNSHRSQNNTLDVLENLTVIDYFTFQHRHLKVTNIDKRTETLFVKLPDQMTTCDHEPISFNHLLGAGSYGAVYTHGTDATVKVYDSISELYHELMVCDMIQIGKEKSENGKTAALIDYLSACTHCHALFLTPYRCSLQDFDYWTDLVIDPLVQGFKGLKDALHFLNKNCGLFHSDVSPSNILVDFTPHLWHMGKLVLTDFGNATLHSGNKMLDVRLKSSKGRQLYKMYYQREPFTVAKDTYKPFMLLSRCYVLRMMGKELDPVTCGPMNDKTALNMDLQCLGYSLLYCLVKLADTTNKIPYPYPNVGLPRSDAAYYLQFAAIKIVLLEVLSQLWNMDVNLGITSCGEVKCVALSQDHLSQFVRWCKSFKKRFAESQFFNCRMRLEHPELPELVGELLATDYFSAGPIPAYLGAQHGIIELEASL
ncbi:ORF27 [callitrichine gammaherpesvirus 3]|uniref:ORF27 n=1 Tax=callitrichine gammaherpesvirus 3 TaxID=106331 RepID=Q993I3_9GAMA|nr:ORF27 [callitrichine gammaherpesvirus 3]AAK38235.1 ORF27 [callitrichine gammaherpesvirus 3]